jgi:hypothetical protein
VTFRSAANNPQSPPDTGDVFAQFYTRGKSAFDDVSGQLAFHYKLAMNAGIGV